MTATRDKYTITIVVICTLLGVAAILVIGSQKTQNRLLVVFRESISSKVADVLLTNNSSKQSKWPSNTLVVIPAIWKEINWINRSSWPSWVRQGLNLSDANPRPYHIHLYQRIDPYSKFPYDWPYCVNVHEEAGVYLQFIRDYYHDLPDKMLFLQGNPFEHTAHPIETAQCIRNDVHFASVNDLWIQNREWTLWPRDPSDNVGLMYKCAKHILTLLGFDAEAQLNPTNKIPKDHSFISAYCCAQFYVTRERIHHYTYEQWLSLYGASLQPFCTTELDREVPGQQGIKWFGGSFEHLWHVILGLQATDSMVPKMKTNTDRCHLFRPSCKGSPCIHH